MSTSILKALAHYSQQWLRCSIPSERGMLQCKHRSTKGNRPHQRCRRVVWLVSSTRSRLYCHRYPVRHKIGPGPAVGVISFTSPSPEDRPCSPFSYDHCCVLHGSRMHGENDPLIALAEDSILTLPLCSRSPHPESHLPMLAMAASPSHGGFNGLTRTQEHRSTLSGSIQALEFA